MRNFLEEAMEQEREAEDREMEEAFPFAGGVGEVKEALGAALEAKRPSGPRKTAAEERGEPLPRRAFPSNDGGREAGGPLALEPSPGRFEGRLFSPAASLSVPARPERPGVPGERGQVSRALTGAGSRPAGVRWVGKLPLLEAVRRAEEGISFVAGQRRGVTVTASEGPAAGAAGLTAEGLDRMVERDARRYDGGFSLY